MRVAAFLSVTLLLMTGTVIADDTGSVGLSGDDITGTLQDATPINAGARDVIVSTGNMGGTGQNDGDGGQGGVGGTIEITGSNYNKPTIDIGIVSDAGYGGVGSGAGRGGQGGAGGDVSYVEDGTVINNEIFVGSQGGNGGPSAAPGDASRYGNGGGTGTVSATFQGTHSGVTAYTEAGDGAAGGNAGTVTVVFDGRTDNFAAYSVGGEGYYGAGGKAGAVDVTITGEVRNNVHVYAAGGSGAGGRGQNGAITVTLENGAVVGGTIIAGDAASAVLEFAFKYATQAELDAAREVYNRTTLASGTIFINGQHYDWSGFTSLKDSLDLLTARNPGAPITITVNEGGTASSPGDAFGGTGATIRGPRTAQDGLFRLFQRSRPASVPPVAAAPVVTGKLRCDSRAVTAFVLSDGSLKVNIRVDGKFYAVGTVSAGAFVPVAGSQWLLSANDDQLAVAGRDGVAIATCKL